MKLRDIFLGKPTHWLILVIVPAVLWFVGDQRVHVRHFNVFLSVVGVLALASVCYVVFGHKPGDAPMREPLMTDDGDEPAP